MIGMALLLVRKMALHLALSTGARPAADFIPFNQR